MTIDSFDIVFYTAVFVLPGFIINSIIDAMNPPKKHNDGIYLLKCIGLSLVSCGVWCWLYKIILERDKLSELWHWILLALTSIVGSALLGIIIAIIKQFQCIDRILSKLKVNTIHTTPTAWDYLFFNQGSAFIIVTLTDDTKLYGWYASNSFTSSDQEERDLFVEIGYKVSEDGTWEEDPQSGGFYVPKDQIKYIEFKKGEETHE